MEKHEDVAYILSKLDLHDIEEIVSQLLLLKHENLK
jgi:hypothetical protein